MTTPMRYRSWKSDDAPTAGGGIDAMTKWIVRYAAEFGETTKLSNLLHGSGRSRWDREKSRRRTWVSEERKSTSEIKPNGIERSSNSAGSLIRGELLLFCICHRIQRAFYALFIAISRFSVHARFSKFSWQRSNLSIRLTISNHIGNRNRL